MQRRIRQVLNALREQGCAGYAKVATMGGFCDLDLLILKATAPDDLPLPERYVHQFLKIFSISPVVSFQTFFHSFTRRFGKTRCWRVALKCLLLLHRLLRTVPQDSLFKAELLWVRSNGLLSLYPCHFRDNSSLNFTNFIRSYAQLLDEAIDFFSMDDKASEDGISSSEELQIQSLSEKMKEIGRVLEVLSQLQSLIDRVMDCRPAASASRSFLVKATMKHILRDSFTCYSIFQRDIVVVMDSLFELPYRNCIAAFDIYKKAAVQAAQLCEFYDWCKARGFCGSYEYPFIDRIPHLHIRALENVLHGMWQMTDSSSSNISSLGSPSPASSPSCLSEDDGDKEMVPTREIMVITQWEKFEEDDDDEVPPLLQLDVSNVSWEALLEASIVVSHDPPDSLFCNSNGYNDRIKDSRENTKLMDGWKEDADI